MMIQRRKIACFLLATALSVAFFPGKAQAAQGTIDTCRINPCYAHPVTGEVEDSGGKASMATGQGMVKGVLGKTGMLETTRDGKMYLTFRMSLMDYTTKQEFKVQKKGETAWQDAEAAVTAQGKDSNGITADVRLAVPDKDCVVRGSMYVKPMGRSVIYYFYPDRFKTGKSKGMKATVVTTVTKKTESQKSENTKKSAAVSTEVPTTEPSEKPQSTAKSSESVETDPADQGLSLSTQAETEGKNTEETKSSENLTMAQQIAVLTISMILAGSVLILIAVGAVYWCRKNWNRWGGDLFED